MPRSRGDREAVRSLLDSGAKIDVAGADGTTALIWAAHRNDTGWPLFCCAQAPTSRPPTSYGATALYAAAANADPEIAAMLLAAGADANARLLSGETPLMEAAERGNLETLRVLLVPRRGSRCAGSNGGQTALMWAISERHSAVDRGAGAARRRRSRPFEQGIHRVDVRRPGWRCRFRARPHWRRREGERRHAENGADALDRRGCHGPHRGRGPAARQRRRSRCRRRRRVHASALCREGQGSGGNGAARCCAHGAKPDVRLIQKKPTVAASGIVLQGATPLALAAEINNLDAVKVLVRGGADPSIPTARNTTPLMLAAGAGTDVARPTIARRTGDGTPNGEISRRSEAPT